LEAYKAVMIFKSSCYYTTYLFCRQIYWGIVSYVD